MHAPGAQRHVNDLCSKVLQLRTTYNGRRMVIVVTHDWYESNGTLPQCARDPRPAVRIIQVYSNVQARSR